MFEPRRVAASFCSLPSVRVCAASLRCVPCFPSSGERLWPPAGSPCLCHYCHAVACPVPCRSLLGQRRALFPCLWRLSRPPSKRRATPKGGRVSPNFGVLLPVADTVLTVGGECFFLALVRAALPAHTAGLVVVKWREVRNAGPGRLPGLLHPCRR